MHIDGIAPDQNVLLVGHLLATGGTMQACCRLVEQAGAKWPAAPS
jgi:adenine phosphoribosyltransferase